MERCVGSNLKIQAIYGCVVKYCLSVHDVYIYMHIMRIELYRSAQISE